MKKSIKIQDLENYKKKLKINRQIMMQFKKKSNRSKGKSFQRKRINIFRKISYINI